MVRRNKILFSILMVILSSVLVADSFSQDILLKIESEEIVGNQFEGIVNILIQNNSNDTILIPLSPFKCELLDNTNYCYSFPRYHTFTHNRITFFEKGGSFKEVSLFNSISYLKLPKILLIAPSSNVILKLTFEEDVNLILKKYSWEVLCDVWYANKKDIDKEISKQYIKEYEAALIKKDTIAIETVFDKRVPFNDDPICNAKHERKINDSTLFLYKDGEKIDYLYKSEYDLILSYFNNIIE